MAPLRRCKAGFWRNFVRHAKPTFQMNPLSRAKHTAPQGGTRTPPRPRPQHDSMGGLLDSRHAQARPAAPAVGYGVPCSRLPRRSAQREGGRLRSTCATSISTPEARAPGPPRAPFPSPPQTAAHFTTLSYERDLSLWISSKPKTENESISRPNPTRPIGCLPPL